MGWVLTSCNTKVKVLGYQNEDLQITSEHSCTGRVGDGMKCSPRQIHDLTVDPIEATRPDLVFSELIFEKLDCRTIIPSRVCHVSLLLCTKWPAVESSARIGNNFGLLHSAQVSPSKKIFRETQSSSQASLSEFV